MRIDATIDAAIRPIAEFLSFVIFYKIQFLGAAIPLVVVWLIAGAVFFTFYFRFINVRGMGHAIAIVRGDITDPGAPGEVSHFQALTAALSGTIGIGNIGGVAVAIAVGGPGVVFWMILAGFLGMSTKFVECTLAVRYRRKNADGSYSGGPMYYLRKGLADRGWPATGRFMGTFYAVGIVVGCLGIGNMFQSNQAFVQLVAATGGAEHSWLADKGWLVGGALGLITGVVILGGIRGIAQVTAKLVPFMAAAYVLTAVIVITLNAAALPAAIGLIFESAFMPEGIAGGALGVMLIGFQRAVFSNEAGIGSAAIAHSAVRTDAPVTEGLVGALGPFIDTVVICTLTALVIVTTQVAAPGFLENSGTEGVATTSAAVGRLLPYADQLLAIPAILFAFSTILSWSYYGLKGWTYLVGHSERADRIFQGVYCTFVLFGATIQLDAVLKFSDALVFLICVPNILGMIILAPVVKEELARYWADRRTPG